jgi:hypothetical protein
VNLEDATRQKSGQLELPLEGRGEAPRAERSGEASTATHGNGRSGTDEARLMERVVERGNVVVALKRVQKNKVPDVNYFSPSTTITLPHRPACLKALS